MRIYVASPLGFSEAGRHFYYGVIIPALEAQGHDVVDPWKLTSPEKIEMATQLSYGTAKRDAWKILNAEIADNNREAIDQSDAIFAVLDGVDVDSGTASEIGYAFAKGKKILGYRGDFRLSADNEGAIVNLQVENFILQSGGSIIARMTELPHALRLITPGS